MCEGKCLGVKSGPVKSGVSSLLSPHNHLKSSSLTLFVMTTEGAAMVSTEGVSSGNIKVARKETGALAVTATGNVNETQ